MSVDWRTICLERARDRVLEYELYAPGPLSPEALAWLVSNGKQYHPETLTHFGIGSALCICYQRAGRRRRSLWSEHVITIPAGPVTRIYRHECPEKADRWRVSPSGYPSQFIGTITGPDVLLVEGEWDLFCAFNYGFRNTASHTAGAGSWLPRWTPMFTDKHVVICYDRDIIGMKGAAKLARALWLVVASVRIVDLPLPGTPTSKDLSDYFRAGATARDFQRLLEGARPYVPRIHPPRRRPDLRQRPAHV